MDERIDLTENRVFLNKAQNKTVVKIDERIDLTKNRVFLDKTQNKKTIIDKHFNTELEEFIKEFEGNCDCCGSTIINKRKTLCDQCDDALSNNHKTISLR